MSIEIQRNPTRGVPIGNVQIGGGADITVQSMTATKTTDVDATVEQAESMRQAGASLVRVAVDNKKDAEALAEVRKQSKAVLVVDLQENYKMVTEVAPHVDKVRYNPGHLYHLEKDKSIEEKVRFIAEVAKDNDCAIRVGVNCGSVDPDYKERYKDDEIEAMVRCAVDHCEILDKIGFERYVVSLKDSDPLKVVDANRRFAGFRPDVPLHLGVTEAGMPPDGVIKTRVAFEQLISKGIGDTIRVSLTLPNPQKYEEVEAGHQILEDIYAGRFRSVPDLGKGLNIISCPSCSRVENEAFVELAQNVKELTSYAKDYDITIAVMGCRVNGPGETDDADLGLWCGSNSVNFKKKDVLLGTFPYEEVIGKLHEEIEKLIASKTAN